MDFLWELWNLHRGKIIGCILGLIIAIIIITFGFLKALFIILCTIIGYYIGKFIDNKEDIRDILIKSYLG